MEIVTAVMLGVLFTGMFVLFLWVCALEGRVLAAQQCCLQTQKLFNEYEGDMNKLIEWMSDNVEVTWEQQQELDNIMLRREGLMNVQYTEGETRETSVEEKI